MYKSSRTRRVLENSAHFRLVVDPMRTQLASDIDVAVRSLRKDAIYARDNSFTESLLSYFEVSIPNEIQVVTELADAGDWQAAKLRIQNQLTDKSTTLAGISAALEATRQTDRQAALDNIAGARLHMLLTWVICGVLSVLFAALLGVTVTRSISRPLARLERSAAALAAGEFAHRIPEEGSNEFTVLSAAFNNAAAFIEESHNTLERRVQARTSRTRGCPRTRRKRNAGKK